MSLPEIPEALPADDKPKPPPARKVKSPRGGIQFDRWGIKFKAKPVNVGEEAAGSWRVVGNFVNAHLRQAAVDLFGLLSDTVHVARKLVRGVGDLKPAKRARVEKVQDLAERAEGRRQERQKSGDRPTPDASAVASQIVDLLADVRAQGLLVDMRELPDGSVAIVMVGHEYAEAAERIIAAALPSPQSTISGPAGIPVANLLTHRLSVILEEHEILTVGRLCDYSARELGLMDGIGGKSLMQIRAALARLGLALKGEEAP